MAKLIAWIGALMLAAGAAPLHAQEMPWCVKLDVFTKNCGFASRDECMTVAANAIGPATGASRCIRNPKYQLPAQAEKPSASQAPNKQPR
jgi:hypothetical protein